MKKKPVSPAKNEPERRPDAKPGAPGHDEWLVDEAVEETFPASDPTAPSHPNEDPVKPRGKAKK
ncbi:MAG TPA: hypothetical protein VHB46_04530 [Burkholderiales bacterium]|nr:hypothetical protein [Burkholderiales bacterium]